MVGTSTEDRYVVVWAESRVIVFDLKIGNRIELCVDDGFYIGSVTLWRSCILIGSSDLVTNCPFQISLTLDREASLIIPSDADGKFWGNMKILEG